MADYTDTLTYTCTLDGITYSDTIEETTATALEVKRDLVHCGTAVTGATELIDPDTLTSGEVYEFDAVYFLVVNKDPSQALLLSLSGTDTSYFKIAPLGFMKFHWTGGGTYDHETTTTGTRVSFSNIDRIAGQFENHEGLVETISIRA